MKIPIQEPVKNCDKITYERKGREIVWFVPHQFTQNKLFGDIMSEHGYPPAAYGMPYDIVPMKDGHQFKCSSSSD